ncbi:MAG: cyclophilin-like fold protein [Candidatus Hydrogenedens sp.]
MQDKREIIICWEGYTLKGELIYSPTANELWEILPVRSITHRWGDEIYFEVPMETILEETATDVVLPGTICFWVEGNSIAIPFGKTPVSVENECRLITDVNIIGKITSSLAPLFSIKENTQIEIQKYQSNKS